MELPAKAKKENPHHLCGERRYTPEETPVFLLNVNVPHGEDKCAGAGALCKQGPLMLVQQHKGC